MSKPTSAPDTHALPPALAERVHRTWENLANEVAELPVAGDAGAWFATLPRVFACSEFVANSCTRHPGLLAELVTGGDLYRVVEPAAIAARVAAALADVNDEAALKATLRRIRRREMVCIAWRDLAGWADVDEMMGAMSALADACLDGALACLHRTLAEEIGTPVGEDSGEPVQLAVLGLGKLGGGELNFSSDVDLIFAYGEDGETRGPRALSNHEFFTRLGRRLIRVIDEPTEDGFVFRVDMRLRPNGDSGPLALSFDAMEQYYQTHGREWERYALIKARPVAGDLAGGGELLARLRPFVYRKYLDYGAIEALRDMKALINRELQRQGIEQNIKLGPGGIREIEFIAQSFQLIRGGRERSLQQRHLLPVLDSLADNGTLTAEAAAQLAAAYRFLRNVEHRLQMVDDRQTQTLPREDLDRSRLALGMNYDDWPAFTQALARVMRRVHEQFDQVFVAPQGEAAETGRVPLKDLWLETLDSAAAAGVLVDAGYPESEPVLALLEQLRRGSAYQAFSSAGRDRMDRLMPLLLGAAGLTDNPLDTLRRLVGLLEAIGRRSVYLALLVENPMALSQLVKLCAASPWISNWISGHPVLLDELLNPASLYAPPSREQLEDELRQWLAPLPAEDLEAQMETLREFRHGHVLRVAAADITGVLGPEEVGDRLCGIAETVLRHVLALAYTGLVERHGEPRGADDEPAGFAVIGYGKLGSLELGYTSDLDMVFLYADAATGGDTDGTRPVANEVFFARLGQRFMHILNSRTPAGILYEVDTRLRPSGQSGPLVTSLGAFASYQEDRAWTWEHQALVRARAVAGDPALGEAFDEVRRHILCRPRDPEALRRDVVEMRDKMLAAKQPPADQVDLKHGRGGIVDIEFIVQYCVLRWAADCAALTASTDNVRLLKTLADAGLLEAEWAQTLIHAYRRFLSAEHHLKLMERPPLIGPDELAPEREAVTRIWCELFE